MENIQDWCISRQLWWGHRIPVWYCDDCREMTVQREDPTQCQHCGSKNIRQDDDVLDTWFSSGLWPFSTLGWPDETADLKYFYPTSVMETGYDILFFWVARMIMDGLEFTGEAPFHTVYLHGLIRDEHGQKMSKTKGNVIDPLIVMDKLGTDALRFTLLVGSAPGNDMNLSEKKVEANRNFANKIWNAGRFVINSIANTPDKPEKAPEWTPADEWMHARMRAVVRSVNRLFENYQFGEAGRQIYDFFWSEFADWYIEIAKKQLREGGDRAFYTAWTLVRILDKCLRMLSPFTPFVTEELWGHLKEAAQAKSEQLSPDDPWAEALMIAQWPESKPEEAWEKDAVDNFSNATMEHARAFRTLKTELNIPANQTASGSIIATQEMLPILEAQKDLIAYSSALKELEILTAIPDAEAYKQYHSSSIAATGSMIFLHTEEAVVDENLRNKLEKELAEANSQIQRLEKLLASDFAKKAPAKVVENERAKLETYRQTVEKLTKQLK
jgi:valyl-tRNA synthetase